MLSSFLAWTRGLLRLMREVANPKASLLRLTLLADESNDRLLKLEDRVLSAERSARQAQVGAADRIKEIERDQLWLRNQFAKQAANHLRLQTTIYAEVANTNALLRNVQSSLHAPLQAIASLTLAQDELRHAAAANNGTFKGELADVRSALTATEEQVAGLADQLSSISQAQIEVSEKSTQQVVLLAQLTSTHQQAHLELGGRISAVEQGSQLALTKFHERYEAVLSQISNLERRREAIGEELATLQRHLRELVADLTACQASLLQYAESIRAQDNSNRTRFDSLDQYVSAGRQKLDELQTLAETLDSRLSDVAADLMSRLENEAQERATDQQRLTQELHELGQRIANQIADLVNAENLTTSQQTALSAATDNLKLALSAHQDSSSTTLTDLAARLNQIQVGIEANLINRAAAHVSRIIPKERTVIFVGRGLFADNIKYAFLAFSQWASLNAVSCWFLARDERQCALLRANNHAVINWNHASWTNTEVQALLRAKIVVMCDHTVAELETEGLPLSLLAGAKTIQLWHGISIKEIALGNLQLRHFKSSRFSRTVASSGPFDLLVGPGKRTEQNWKQWLAFERYAPIGYPRNDVLLRTPTPADLLNVDLIALELARSARLEGHVVLLFAPTFRDGKGAEWLTDACFAELCAHCVKQNYVLFVNLHPYEHHFVPALKEAYSGVHFVEPGTDAYPLLREVSVLITDYSSIALDFLFLDRPIVYSHSDVDKYNEEVRQLIPEYRSYLAGAQTSGTMELLLEVDRAVVASRAPRKDPHRARRKAVRRQLFDNLDGKAALRLVGLIETMLEPAAASSRR